MHAELLARATGTVIAGLNDGTACQQPTDHKTGFLVVGSYILGLQLHVIVYAFAVSYYVSYFRSALWTRDSRRTKAVTLSVFLLATLSAALSFYSSLWWSTKPQRAMPALYDYEWNDVLAPLPMAIASTIVQAYLSHRSLLFIQSRNKRIAMRTLQSFLIVCCAIANLLLPVSSILFKLNIYSAFGAFDYSVSTRLWLALSAVTDTLIASTFAVTLRSRKAGFSETTDRRLDRLSNLSWTTGAYTAVLAIAGAIVAASTASHIQYFSLSLIFWLPLCPVYALSLIMNLACRSDLLPSSSSLAAADVAAGAACMQEVVVRRPALRSKASGRPISALSVGVSIERTQTFDVEEGAIEYSRMVDKKDREAALAGLSSVERDTAGTESTGRRNDSGELPMLSHWMKQAGT